VKKILTGLYRNVYVRAGLAFLISAVTLILAVRNVTLRDFWRAISTADNRFLLLAIASVALNTAAKTIRWKVLLGKPAQNISLWTTFQAILVGQTLNTIYPARIGDFSRMVIVGDRGPGRAFTLGTILLEKLLDTLFYALLGVILLLSIPLPGWMSAWANKTVYLMAGASLGAVLILMAVARNPGCSRKAFEGFWNFITRYFPGLDFSKPVSWFDSGVASLEVLKSGRGLVYVTFWLAVSWVTALLNNQLALLALGIHLPLTASLLVLIVLQAGISIPSVPGRIGIFEYSCVITLALFGVKEAAAFTYGLLLHCIVFIPPTLLGLFFIILLGLPVRRVVWSESPRENH
jgi:uncharacterized protein (TIRG00374 family)